jgi:hypothetical protein
MRFQDGAKAPVEPSGVHLSGQVKPFRGLPFPPDWVRLDSQILADPDCHHYVYEVYVGKDQWLVRYVMLPEVGEGFRDAEQMFLYPMAHGQEKPKMIAPVEVQIGVTEATWNGMAFRLVDRRDLMRN